MIMCFGVQSEPVRGRRQITSAERTNMWSVCLTSKGVLNYLNRRISPVGTWKSPSKLHGTLELHLLMPVGRYRY